MHKIIELKSIITIDAANNNGRNIKYFSCNPSVKRRSNKTIERKLANRYPALK